MIPTIEFENENERMRALLAMEIEENNDVVILADYILIRDLSWKP